jgi:YVTN family beta-propeller protein
MRTLTLVLLPSLLLAQTADRPVRAVTDPGVVTTRQSITPAGIPTIFNGKVWGVSFGATSGEIWVLTAGQVFRLDWRENKVLSSASHGSQPGLLGIAVNGGRTFVSAVPRQKKAALFSVENGLKPVAESLGANNAGGIATAGDLAVVPLPFENKAAIIELSTGKIKGYAATGIAPFAAAINKSATVAYVSNWGGRKPVAGDKTAPTGMAASADQVVVDAQGIASTGTVSRVDLATMQVTHTIATGLHPNGLAWDEAAQRLYVANNNSDTVTAINTTTNAVAQTLKLKPFAVEASGIAPTAVALHNGKLYVTCGGINAVAVIDAKSMRQEGLIPTGWYPNSISVSPDGKHLAVGSLLGAGSGWQNEPKRRYVHANRGSVNVIDIPDAAQLARYTIAVSENNHLALAGTSVIPATARVSTPKAVPAKPGDASLIEHVVYIVKENRTYDQLFGDLGKGNGEPSFVMFGEDVAPNQRKLAREFVLLDNFYASGGNSADGHQWLTQANEVAYTMWPGYQGRSYPFDGTDPIGIAQGGTIWDAALKRGKTVKIYGEYAGRQAEPASQRIPNLRKWKEGGEFTFNTAAPIAHMNAFVAKHYPAYSNAVPDVVRAQIFKKDLEQFEKDGKMPNLTILQLPCDHTYGTSPGASTPKAMVADNDLAVGLIVEALSKSKFWPKMAIYIVEDDAQNGVDHVDGHRTVALAISPYIRRGHVDSTFYSNQSMLKTMELQLGLPPLALFDLIANDMSAGFSDTADLKPYEHVVPQQDLFAVNPPASALKGAARKGARESAKMRWDVPDAVPTEKLNRILWHAIKGEATAYPKVRQAVFAPYSLDVDDDDR